MNAVANAPIISPSNLRTAQVLSILIVLLTAVACIGGLFIPHLYRDPAGVLPAIQGQDLLTLASLPVLVVALLAAGRGSARAVMVWVGLLGYIFYTYTGASFSYHLNYFCLIYVALFSLSAFVLATVMTGIHAAELQQRFDAATPRGAVTVFLALLALLLAVLWLGQLVPFFLNNTLPAIVTRADAPTSFVYVLDLGLIVPLSLLAVRWLRHRSPWGDLLAGIILIKATTMGIALLSMTWFSYRAGLLVMDELGLLIFYIVLTVSGLTLSVWFFRHCRE